MWIRSQDRRMLIKVNFAYVPSYEAYYEACGKRRSIWVHTENDSFSVGTYATQERALEVLDEIQHTICHHVYQMPEK